MEVNITSGKYEPPQQYLNIIVAAGYKDLSGQKISNKLCTTELKDELFGLFQQTLHHIAPPNPLSSVCIWWLCDPVPYYEWT